MFIIIFLNNGYTILKSWTLDLMQKRPLLLLVNICIFIQIAKCKYASSTSANSIMTIRSWSFASDPPSNYLRLINWYKINNVSLISLIESWYSNQKYREAFNSYLHLFIKRSFVDTCLDISRTRMKVFNSTMWDWCQKYLNCVKILKIGIFIMTGNFQWGISAIL